MNNDKRMILAIAVYAAVITMILHTLSAEGHERVLADGSASTESKSMECRNIDYKASILTTAAHDSLCSDDACISSDGEIPVRTLGFVQKDPEILEQNMEPVHESDGQHL